MTELVGQSRSFWQPCSYGCLPGTRSDNNSQLAARCRKSLKNLRKRPANDLLMHLRQLTGNDNWSIDQYSRRFLEQIANSMRCLEENYCMGDLLDRLKKATSVFCPSGGKIEHGDGRGRKPGGHQRRQWSARTGDHVYRHAVADARLYEFETGV